MIWILAVALVCSSIAMLLVVTSAHRHAHWSADHDLSGPQKMHAEAVPRVGGVGIFVGVAGGVVAALLAYPEARRPLLMFVVCMLPAFGAGLWEDFTKAISPRRRMLACAVSGVLGGVLLDAVIRRTGWMPLDHLLLANGLAWAGAVGAVFAVTGVSNSLNIVDGMNGLASMCAVL